MVSLELDSMCGHLLGELLKIVLCSVQIGVPVMVVVVQYQPLWVAIILVSLVIMDHGFLGSLYFTLKIVCGMERIAFIPVHVVEILVPILSLNWAALPVVILKHGSAMSIAVLSQTSL